MQSLIKPKRAAAIFGMEERVRSVGDILSDILNLEESN
jgi:hypothetical protein